MTSADPHDQARPAGARPRILRIGILLGGKLVEERLIPGRVPVTIGQSMRNTFSVPIDGLPLEFTLFAPTEGGYALRFLPGMDGRLSDRGGEVTTLDALKAHGAHDHGDHFQVALTPSSRGKLSLGDLTILFQFVHEPPRQPRPMLPPSVRGTLADRLDLRLSAILGLSICVHFTVAILALLSDVPIEDGIAERAYNLTFKQDTYTVDLTQPEPGASRGSGAAAEKEKEPERTDRRPSRARASGRDEGGGKSEEAVLREEAARFADLLTGEGDHGTSEGDMSARRPGADLGAQISEVRDAGQTVEIGGGAGRISRGGGDIRVGTGRGPEIAAPASTESAGGGKTQERIPGGRISVADKQTFDESSLTPDLVLAKIQSAYMAGLKRCYKEYLKKDASARGKVTLSLTVNETGRTVKGSARGFAGEVDECIGNLMTGWRFPVPRDRDGEATEASFAITLQLVPD